MAVTSTNGGHRIIFASKGVQGAKGDDGTGVWGTISGDINTQIDLQAQLAAKKNDFTENTGFNKDFGSTIGTVCQGDDSRLSDSRVPTAHTHLEVDITDLDKYTQLEVDTALALKEDSFLKNTAFNKDFGATISTVCEGNDSRLSDARTPLAHTHTEVDITDLDKYTQAQVDSALALKENSFSKNTAFNKNFGTLIGEVCEGNDSRLSDSRTPLAHTHLEADITDLDKYTQLEVDTLLNGKEDSFAKNTGFNKNFGSIAGTVCEGNDSRLSDSRTPLAHTHVESEITDLDKYTQAEVDSSISGITGVEVKVGSNAGATSQGVNAVAVGNSAGATSQGSNAVAIGDQAGTTSQGASAVAVGYLTGNITQGANATAIGNSAGNSNQQTASVAVGYLAGATSQGSAAVAVGFQSGQTTQGANSIAIGNQAGNGTQAASSVAIGIGAGQTNQAASSVAVGNNAGNSTQGTQAVAVGYLAGQTTQGINSVAIGNSSGKTTQAANSVAVGNSAGQTNQAASSVAVGYIAGQTTQGTQAVSVGYAAGNASQGAQAVAVGYSAGQTTQGNNSVAVGYIAGQTSQSTNSVAVGYAAGQNSLGVRSTAVGYRALQSATGADNTGLGDDAGQTTTTGSQNTFVGSGTTGAAVGNTNETVVGYNVTGNGSNTVTLGNASVLGNYLNGGIYLVPMTAPANPASGFVLYVDSADGDLKAKASTGVTTTIASN